MLWCRRRFLACDQLSTRLSIFYFIFNFLLFEVKRAKTLLVLLLPSFITLYLKMKVCAASVCWSALVVHRDICRAVLFCSLRILLCCSLFLFLLSSLSPYTSLVARHPAPPPDLTPPCHIQLTHMPRAIAKLIRSEGLSFVFHTHFFHM